MALTPPLPPALTLLSGLSCAIAMCMWECGEKTLPAAAPAGGDEGSASAASKVKRLRFEPPEVDNTVECAGGEPRRPARPPLPEVVVVVVVVVSLPSSMPPRRVPAVS